MNVPNQSKNRWIESRRRRGLELGLIGVAAPLLGGAALVASGMIARRYGRGAVTTEIDRSLYPGHRFTVKKLGDPESEERLLRLCRQAMIDEVPQVVDIIRGDMALFGPRADKPQHIEELFAAIENDELRERWRQVRSDQKPGIISSYAILSHGNNLNGDPEYSRFGNADVRARNAELRARCDIHDHDNCGFRHDLSLVAKTVVMAFGNYRQYYRQSTKSRK